MRKGEIACNEQFLLFLQCFIPHMGLIFHFKYTFKCRLQFVSIWTSLKLSSGNGLKARLHILEHFLRSSKHTFPCNELTLFYLMTPFDGSREEDFWKHCGKMRNCLYKPFLLFPQGLLLYQRQNLSFLLHFSFRLQMHSIWCGHKICGNGFIH